MIATIPDNIPTDLFAEEGEVFVDGDIAAEVDREGNILSLTDAPADTADVAVLADWLGPRRVGAVARAAALQAEKAAWIKQINDRFDPQIKKQQRLVAWLNCQYKPILRDFLRRLLEGKEARSAPLGLLRLKFTLTRPRMDVVDKAAAIAWCEEHCPEAIKTERSVLVSLIPDTLRAELPPESGLSYYAGGEDEFEVT